jgi:hypothetical protein
MQSANPENEPKHGLAEHLRKDRLYPNMAEKGFPVVDTGTDFPLYLLAYSHIGLVRSVREGLRLNSEFLPGNFFKI